MIVILTDGVMVDEEIVMEFLEEGLGAGRLFVVGIGDNVKRETIRRIAEYGRGTAAFASDIESLNTVVAQLFDSVAAPLAWDLELEWGETLIETVQPERLFDLYASRTVTAVARILGVVPQEIGMRGFTKEGERTWTAAVKILEGVELHELSEPRDKPAAKKGRPKKK